eukprot:276450-Prorocentrum_minimum.AAC.1
MCRAAVQSTDIGRSGRSSGAGRSAKQTTSLSRSPGRSGEWAALPLGVPKLQPTQSRHTSLSHERTPSGGRPYMPVPRERELPVPGDRAPSADFRMAKYGLIGRTRTLTPTGRGMAVLCLCHALAVGSLTVLLCLCHALGVT